MNKPYRVISVILLLALCASVGFTAAHLYDLSGVEIQVSEATAAKATIYIDVGVHEAQTVTVSKAGGAFGATAGTTSTQVVGTMYKLVIHAGDLDTEGFVAFLSTGATDNTTVYNIMVVDHDPFDAVAVAPADYLTATGIAADALAAAKFATGALTADAFAADALVAATFATGVLTADAFAADALVAATFATDSITADAIADDAIDAGVIATAAIGADEIAADAIGASELADGAIDAGSLAANCIDATKVADNTIDAGAIAGDSITAAKIATAAIGADEIATDAIGAAEIAASAIGTSELATGALTADEFAADAIVAATLATGALTADAFAADAIVAATLATGVLSADAFAADALVAATFATDSIAADAVADGAIDAGAIATAAIGAAEIATDAIGAAELAADAVVEIAAGVGTSPVRVTRAQVQRSEVDADRRTVYFYAEGTLPAYASVSKNGAAFANSTNAPATVNGSFRSLEFTRAELAAVGRYVVNVTTTGTVATAFIVVDVTADDVFARSGLGPR